MKIPLSSYRLQITAGFDLAAAAEQIGYLAKLGADWVYLSPLLASEPGSDHGYDVVDHGVTDAPRGGRAGFALLADTAHGAGLGVLVDIVPNHVGIATPHDSRWWWDVLANGRDSLWADAFDIDWPAGGGRIRIPVLGDSDAELDALRVADGELTYYEHRFPIADGTGGGTPQQVHHRQHYELVNWRRADAELNYRRFFAVSSLAGIRVEDPAVFDASHVEIGHWLVHGWVDGLRVDHPDGLADPAGYLRRLAELTGGAYTVVEKILEPGEGLPAEWMCAGTTGYETLGLVDRLLVDPAGQQPLAELASRLNGAPPLCWPDLTHRTRRGIADGILRSEVLRLARLMPDIEDAADAVAELVSCFPVYRSYLPGGAEYLAAAVSAATSYRPELATAIAAVGARLAEVGTEISVRFEQTSGAVRAKGVEDTAFYRYTRLTSLTEVGAVPSQFSITAEQFHDAQLRRLADWPNGMTTLSTHDTKRSEDVRARISVLAEMPDQWAAFVGRTMATTGVDDGPLANLLLQAAFGAWPIEPGRLQAYALKASREAGDRTNWWTPAPEFERRIHALIETCYHGELNQELTELVGAAAAAGRSNALSAKLIQLTLPGVPDVYQGTELWDNSLVDPDNRRPVDFELRADLLAKLDGGWLPDVDESGAAKLLVVSRALRLRRDSPSLFTGYSPVLGSGHAAQHLIGFDRGSPDRRGAITLATRLPIGLAAADGWQDTVIPLAADWVDVITGRPVPVTDYRALVGDVLDRYPVALLIPPLGA